MELLLYKFPHESFATEVVLIAAAGNKELADLLVDPLLDEPEEMIEVTNAVVEAAVSNSLDPDTMMDLRYFIEK